jgi:hypothetical protein
VLRLAHVHRLTLRQSYARVSKLALICHTTPMPSSLKRANRALRYTAHAAMPGSVLSRTAPADGPAAQQWACSDSDVWLWRKMRLLDPSSTALLWDKLIVKHEFAALAPFSLDQCVLEQQAALKHATPEVDEPS